MKNQFMLRTVLTLFNELSAISNKLQRILRLPNEYQINKNAGNYTDYYKKCEIVEHGFCFKHKKCGRCKHELRTKNQRNYLGKVG